MSTATHFVDEPITVKSDNCKYTDTHIESSYEYNQVLVEGTTVIPSVTKMKFRTARKVPKTGLMLVGWGGNNGSTTTAGIIANTQKMSWQTKEKEMHANYFGSMTQSSTVKLGNDAAGVGVYMPLKNLLPMVAPNDLVVGGWDISSMTIGDAMRRSKVLDVNLQDQLYPHMKDLKPLPSIYFPDFIAANQAERADNVLTGSKFEQMEAIRKDIREFKAANKLDKVILLWTANTERFAAIEEDLNDTSSNLMAALKRDEPEISPSTCFAIASILEGCTYINGSPQNTFVPGVLDLAEQHKVFVGGDDFKSGQTKMKSVLVDFLVSAGIKPVSIVSYNHLGNNDGKNLSAPSQFRSKEISKSNVVDDMVGSNRVLYEEDEHPDHVVVIKYVPYVADSKRALDEYTSEIFLGGKNTICMHNTCEDSLLATPIIYDLAILAEICERIEVQVEGGAWEKFHPVLSMLSYLIKAPLVPRATPVINALFAQRQCIVNVFRACLGLPTEDNMLLEHKIPSMINGNGAAASSSSAAAAGPPSKKARR